MFAGTTNQNRKSTSIFRFGNGSWLEIEACSNSLDSERRIQFAKCAVVTLLFAVSKRATEFGVVCKPFTEPLHKIIRCSQEGNGRITLLITLFRVRHTNSKE